MDPITGIICAYLQMAHHLILCLLVCQYKISHCADCVFTCTKTLEICKVDEATTDTQPFRIQRGRWFAPHLTPKPALGKSGNFACWKCDIKIYRIHLNLQPNAFGLYMKFVLFKQALSEQNTLIKGLCCAVPDRPVPSTIYENSAQASGMEQKNRLISHSAVSAVIFSHLT